MRLFAIEAKVIKKKRNMMMIRKWIVVWRAQNRRKSWKIKKRKKKNCKKLLQTKIGSSCFTFKIISREQLCVCLNMMEVLLIERCFVVLLFGGKVFPLKVMNEKNFINHKHNKQKYFVKDKNYLTFEHLFNILL